ncbi:hypothetical protein Ciccas_012998 [Cichlidogyrus casuarinus]|uniref:Uncharacterized protein n=1 Tax=Cichlidogyrus casuarinus TaxID=1844966 RepID=A0ABD2PP64_9PLAT
MENSWYFFLFPYEARKTPRVKKIQLKIPWKKTYKSSGKNDVIEVILPIVRFEPTYSEVSPRKPEIALTPISATTTSASRQRRRDKLALKLKSRKVGVVIFLFISCPLVYDQQFSLFFAVTSAASARETGKFRISGTAFQTLISR